MESFKVIIIGSGAAGLNCALQLYNKGIKPDDIAIITDKLGGGTSFNAGSDKQTYYKISTVGSDDDSPYKMALNLYKGGAMHGDIALIESTCSIQAFMNLVNIGVPFPHDKYGAYIGYKTDNDDLQRGTSTGPLTSKIMGEKLLKSVQNVGIIIKDQMLVIDLLKTENNIVCGVSCLKLNELDSKKLEKDKIHNLIEIFQADFIVLATGGPASIYKNSVYPISQWGSTSLSIKSGAVLQNLTESQYGLASIKFRWNVSGTYQQVIPRYFSLPDGEDPISTKLRPHEFLKDYFPNITELTRATFLKGYQWPFNPERIANYGSSLIDMAVHIETIEKKNHVYLDFMNNPSGYDFELLSEDAKTYLDNSGAKKLLPIDRLNHMNPKAIELYKNHGIDLYKEPLEICVCAQHNNGGVKGDIWWESSIHNLFSIGELNGSHGVHRPGGSALNSGQVGGIRVSDKICYGSKHKSVNNEEFNKVKEKYQEIFEKHIKNLYKNTNNNEKNDTLNKYLNKIQNRMMVSGAYIRNSKEIDKYLKDCKDELISIKNYSRLTSISELITYYRVLDALITQYTYLTSIKDYIDKDGGSRGSYIIIDSNIPIDIKNNKILGKYPIKKRNYDLDEQIQEISFKKSEHQNYIPESYEYNINWIKRRKIPNDKQWFENVWRDFDTKRVFE